MDEQWRKGYEEGWKAGRAELLEDSEFYKKLDKILELLQPKAEINKELRANIKKALSHGKKPRKQPKDTTIWKEAYKKRKSGVQ